MNRFMNAHSGFAVTRLYLNSKGYATCCLLTKTGKLFGDPFVVHKNALTNIGPRPTRPPPYVDPLFAMRRQADPDYGTSIK